MEEKAEQFCSGPPEIIKKAWRVSGWTLLLVILTFLFLSVIEGKGPLDAISDFDLFLGVAAFLICVVTAVLFEVVRSLRSTG